jgi:hypothetical protein
MPIVATVTSCGGSTFFSQDAANIGGQGGNAFTLRKADGTSLGGFNSRSEAQASFNQTYGRNRIYRWERRDLRGGIEQWVCIGSPIDPSEIWQLQGPSQVPNALPADSSLIQWIEPSLVPGSVKLADVATGAISTVSDLSGSANALTAQSATTLVAEDSAFSGRPVFDIDRLSLQGFSVPSLLTLAPPWTMVLVANNLDGVASGTLVHVDDGGAAEFRLQTGAGAGWQARVGVGAPFTLLDGSSAFAAVISVKATASELQFRVAGVAIGTIPLPVGTGALKIGGYDTAPWGGRLAFFMLANIADADNTRIAQTERYCHERYGVTVA